MTLDAIMNSGPVLGLIVWLATGLFFLTLIWLWPVIRVILWILLAVTLIGLPFLLLLGDSGDGYEYRRHRHRD